VTLTEFAALVGVSKMTVSTACKPGGRLASFVIRSETGRATGIRDPEEARKYFHANTDLSEAPASVLVAKAEFAAREAEKRSAEENADDEDPPEEKRSAPKTATAFEEIADESRRAKHWDAKLKELKYREAAGELVAAAGIEKKLADVFSAVRSKLLGVPSKAKQAMPDELTASMVTKIEDLIREALEELVPPDEKPE
jgi:phage terminase Nu1 subunit (DNA packaging protein)